MMKIRTLHYKNSLGTDLTVSLPEGYRFAGGRSTLKNGLYYYPNIPTEEVFSAPYKYGLDGTLYSSMPLNYNGSLVQDFWFRFEKGKVIECHARKGKHVLESILDTDDGSRYLGELALVPYGSPIQRLQTLFYETLIDENASCHFALGQSYAECLENGLDLEEEALAQKGLNQSSVHVDFMVGTEDLQIDAYTESGEIIRIFEKGKYSDVFD
jgi:aminopeptidase